MDDLESRVATLLRAAVPEPPHDLDVDALISARPPRRARRIVAPIAAAAAVAGIAIGLAVTASPNHRAPATHATAQSRTWAGSDFTLRYPAAWHPLPAQNADSHEGYRVLDIVNQPIPGVTTVNGPARLSRYAIDIHFAVLELPKLTLREFGGRSLTTAGQRAKIGSHAECPAGATGYAAEITLRTDTLLTVTACFGADVSPGDRQIVRRMITTGIRTTGAVSGHLDLVGGAPPGETIPVGGVVTLTGPMSRFGLSRQITVTVPASGAFTISDLTPGKYSLSAISPHYRINGKPGPCSGPDVVVQAGRNATVQVGCSMK